MWLRTSSRSKPFGVGGDQDGGGAQGIVDDFEERGPHVQVLPTGARQQGDTHRVPGEANEPEHDHRPRGDFRRVEQPPEAFDEDEHPDREQDRGDQR